MFTLCSIISFIIEFIFYKYNKLRLKIKDTQTRLKWKLKQNFNYYGLMRMNHNKNTLSSYNLLFKIRKWMLLLDISMMRKNVTNMLKKSICMKILY